MFGGKLGQASPQNRACILLLHRDFGIITGILNRACGLVVELLIWSLSQGREGLVSSNRQQPCRNLRSSFETVRRAPDIQEHVVDQVLRTARVAHKSEDEAINTHV